MPEIATRVTEVTVCALPEDHIDHDVFAIRVQWRSGDRYAVKLRSRCLGADGEWSYEMNPSGREDEWIATHRFSYDEALLLAVQAAPHVKVDGHTVAEVLAAESTEVS